MVSTTAVRRLRSKLRRLEEQHAIAKERSRIAQDIHDELGANLTRIELVTEVGQKHRGNPAEREKPEAVGGLDAEEAFEALLRRGAREIARGPPHELARGP